MFKECLFLVSPVAQSLKEIGRLSATHGYHGAENVCKYVALGMTREEVAEGGRRAAEFVPDPNA